MSDLKSKVLDATSGSQFGAILANVFGEDIPAPCFVGKAIVTSDGYVQCNFTGKDGRQHNGAFVGSIRDLAENAVRLAKHLNLTAEERREFSTALFGWFAVDYTNDAVKATVRRLKGDLECDD